MSDPERMAHDTKGGLIVRRLLRVIERLHCRTSEENDASAEAREWIQADREWDRRYIADGDRLLERIKAGKETVHAVR